MSLAVRELRLRTALGALVWLAACASAPAPAPATTTTATAPPPAPHKSLYERLGGKNAIEAVVDDLIGRVKADHRIKMRFLFTDFKNLRAQLVDQLCAATGGPCTYAGRDMKTVHAGMHIHGADFDALVEDLKGSLAALKVPDREQGELLALLAPMRADVVEEP